MQQRHSAAQDEHQRQHRSPFLKFYEILVTEVTDVKALPHKVPARGPAESKGLETVRFASLIKACASHDGCFDLRVPGVHVIRRSRIYTEVAHGVQQSAVCIVAQGAKSVMVGREVYEYDPSRMIVFSVDMPVAAQVTRASITEPFLCLRLDLNPQKVADLVLKVFPRGLPPVHGGGVLVAQADQNIISAAVRLIELTRMASDAELIAPLVVDEILIRLLRSPVGIRMAQIGLAESGVWGIAKAVSWLRSNFSQPNEGRRVGQVGEYECLIVSPAFSIGHFDESAAVPEGATSARGEAPDVIA